MGNEVRTHKRKNPFVQIDKAVFNDPNLSWKAKGILGYLLSKPDDWKTYVSDLVKRSKDGRDAVSKGLLELEEHGYLVKWQKRKDGGQFGGYNYEVFEYPEDACEYKKALEAGGKAIFTANGFSGSGKSVNGKTVSGKTENGKPETTNNDISNNDLRENDLSNKFNNMEFASLTKFYEMNFGLITPFVADDLKHWSEQFEEIKIIEEALKLTLKQNKRTFSYAEGILKSWQSANLKTLHDVTIYQEEEARKRKEAATARQNTYNGRRQQGPNVTVPDYLKGESAAEQSSTSEEENAEWLDNLLKNGTNNN
jgi:DnaD/phage-associated family protein